MKRIIICLFLLTMLVTAVPVAAADDTLIVAMAADMTGLDPHLQTAFTSHKVLDMIHGKLVEVDEKMIVQPSMAESWDWSEDGMELTVHLREGMTFHNGTPITSADVKFSFERILDEATGAAARSKFTSISSIEVPDNLTVVFKFAEKNVAILVDMASNNAAILSKDFFDNGGDPNVESVGAGPYKLVKWEPDNRIELTAHEGYFIDGMPKIKNLEYRIIPAEDSILAGVRTGEIDFAIINEPATAMIASADPGVVVASAPALSYHVLQLNPGRDVFKDVRVRQAIACAIDRQEVLDVAALGEGQVTPPVVQPYFAADTSTLFCYKKDLEKSKALLAEAGNPEISFTIMAAADEPPTAVAEAQNIQDQLSEIGIKVDIEVLELGVYVERWLAGDFDSCAALNGGGTDPNGTFWRYWHSSGNLQKVSVFNAPELDELLVQGRSNTDPAERLPYYIKAQEILAENAPWIWLYVGYEYRVMVPSLKGFIPTPDGSVWSLRQVYFE